MGTLSEKQINDALPRGWSGSPRGLHAVFATGSFSAGTSFVDAICEAAESANHHPDVLLTYPSVEVFTISHDVDGVTKRDLDLAAAISQIAVDKGFAVDPHAEARLNAG